MKNLIIVLVVFFFLCGSKLLIAQVNEPYKDAWGTLDNPENYIPRFDRIMDKYIKLEKSVIYEREGDIGIGTIEPSAKLDVHGESFGLNIQAGLSALEITSAHTGIRIHEGVTNYGIIQFGEETRNYFLGYFGIGYSSTQQFGSKFMVKENAAIGFDDISTTAPTDGLIVNGNVGIGTSEPSAKLDVHAGSFGLNIQAGTSALEITSAQTGIRIHEGVTNYGIIQYGEGTRNYFSGYFGIGYSSTQQYGSKFMVKENAAIGFDDISTTAPTDGLIVNGNVGIGTSSPSASLHVSSIAGYGENLVHFHNNSGGGAGRTLYLTNSGGTVSPLAEFINSGTGNCLKVTNNSGDWAAEIENNQANSKGFLIKSGLGGAYPENPILQLTNVDNYLHFIVQANGNVGVGSADPSEKLDINGKLHMRDNIKLNGNWLTSDGDDQGVFVDNFGKVGIGTDSPDALLTVAGKINAQEIEVTVDAGEGADFVFEDNYELNDLSWVDEFVKQNKHLPEISSAKEMHENGLNMGDFQIQLLKKIEELTLYIIEQQKRIEKLEYEIHK